MTTIMCGGKIVQCSQGQELEGFGAWRLCSLYEELENADKTVGVKQTAKAAQKDLLECVYLAMDADKRIIRELEETCKIKNIPLKYAESMKQLGKACGIEVGASAAGILKSAEKNKT